MLREDDGGEPSRTGLQIAEVWALVGHATMDLAFANELIADIDDIAQRSGYDLSPEQKALARDTVVYLLTATGSDAAFQREQMQANMTFQREQMQANMASQSKRGRDMSEYTLQLFKDTLSNAANTYKTITAMNKVMFVTGLLLFVASGIVGVFSAGASAVLLGALGGATFVALFLTGPIEKSQTALSNLVQVEAGFMNHFEQMTFWENYAFAPAVGNPSIPDPARIEKASDELQKRTSATMELLQRYVEPAPETKSTKGRSNRRDRSDARKADPA